ncbi:metallophosphoesterase [Microbacterium sp. A84]|uniref:metallophosphoesterase n=1 Tax=Microbacterium sp. A84 TaxID=3450715 RepID=UPI003F41EA66
MTLDLPDTTVGILGDVHGSPIFLRKAIWAIRKADPSVTTILQLGDFWVGRDIIDAADDACAGTSIKILVTLGNHEPYGGLDVLMSRVPGKPISFGPHITILPRPFRFTIAGRSVLSVGGASSPDKGWRTPGIEWWPDELITDEQVAEALAGGPADILLTHESAYTDVVPAVRQILRMNPGGFPASARAESAASRRQVDLVRDVVRPRLALHGHFHTYDTLVLEDKRFVVSVASDGQPYSVMLLDVDALRLTRVEI